MLCRGEQVELYDLSSIIFGVATQSSKADRSMSRDEQLGHTAIVTKEVAFSLVVEVMKSEESTHPTAWLVTGGRVYVAILSCIGDLSRTSYSYLHHLTGDLLQDLSPGKFSSDWRQPYG
jgi:hypothetical protein